LQKLTRERSSKGAYIYAASLDAVVSAAPGRRGRVPHLGCDGPRHQAPRHREDEAGARPDL